MNCIKYKNRLHTYIIAEIGVNHNGSVEHAIELVDLASSAGADAVKFQSFRAEDLSRIDTPKVQYQITNTCSGETHYEMLKKLELSKSQHQEIISYCQQKSINFISTPYSINAVEMLEDLGVSEYKIASADLVDIPLLEAIAATRKPSIISLGMASLAEIEFALRKFSTYKPSDLALLHCVSNYPCSDTSLNLNVINTLKQNFPYSVGLSDHSIGSVGAILSVGLGASIIEKHFTSNKALEGPDHKASSTPNEFSNLVKNIRRSEAQLGNRVKTMQNEEKEMAQISRKSLAYSRDILVGETLHKTDFMMIRPGTGLPWQAIDGFIGNVISTARMRGDHCSLSDILCIKKSF